MKNESQILMFSDLIRGKENNFDVLRFLTAAAVIFSHAFPLTGLQDPLLIWSNGQVSIGDLAVITFFVISGYFITQSYHYSQSPFKYIKARLLRIFPALIAAVVFSVLVIGAIFTNMSLKEYFGDLETYIYLKAILLYPMQWFLPGVFENNLYANAVNGSLWSIPFEFMFYILVLLLGIFSLLNKKVSVVLFSIVSILYVLDYWPLNTTHFWGLEIKKIIELLSYFVAGMVFYFFREKIPFSNFIALISLVLLFMAVYIGGLKELFIVLGTYLIFYLGYNPKLKTWKFYKYGDFSYGIYVFGFPVQQAVVDVFNNEINPYTNFAISFVITLVLAIISWYLIEDKALQLKNKSFLNKFIVSSFEKIGAHFNHLILAFKSFILEYVKVIVPIFLILFGYNFHYINSYSNEITFPYLKSTIFSEGWLNQSPDEDYRWIAGSASVKIQKDTTATTLEIIGYVPADFTEVKTVTVFIDGMERASIPITDGQVHIVTDVGYIQGSKILEINIVFNDVHKPKETEPDQRQMSGLISSIKVY